MKFLVVRVGHGERFIHEVQYIKSLNPIKFFIPLPAELNNMVDSPQRSTEEQEKGTKFMSQQKKNYIPVVKSQAIFLMKIFPFSGDMARLS